MFISNIINKTINKGYQADSCEVCAKHLSLFTLKRIHKCKRCLRFVCSNCGTHKAIVSGQIDQPNKPHRICDVCYRELDIQEKIIHRNDLQWNQNSYLSEKWRNAINLHQLKKQKQVMNTFGYYDYLAQYAKNMDNYAQDVEIITKDVDLGRSDACVFNYSARQFIEKLQEGITAEGCRENIKNVLIALVVRYPYLGYCQGMNYLAVTLLCFTSEEIAFSLYCHLIENILPDRYFQKNGKGAGLIGFMAECFVLRNIAVDYFPKEEIQIVQSFLEMQCPNYLLTLLINTLNITCVFFVWDKMFMENSVVPLEQCIIALMKINKPSIMTFARQPDVGEIILRTTTYDELKAMMNFEISNDRRHKLMDEFYQEFSEKWTKDSSQIHYQLKKITEFSIEEIKQIQKEFNKLLEQKYLERSVEEDSSSELEGSTTMTSLTASKFFKKGINQEEFIALMMKINAVNTSDEKITIHSSQMSKIFDLFVEVDDNDKDHPVLDLREFLCCMSMVTRGDVRQKLEIFFYMCDSNQKQFLYKQEFFFLINTLLQSIPIIEKNTDLKEASNQFLEELNQEYNKKEKISLSDFLLLLSHPFIQNITFLQQTTRRRDTCIVLAKNLQDLYQR